LPATVSTKCNCKAEAKREKTINIEHNFYIYTIEHYNSNIKKRKLIIMLNVHLAVKNRTLTKYYFQQQQEGTTTTSTTTT